jgi:small subunit ribosomal protein S8e
LGRFPLGFTMALWQGRSKRKSTGGRYRPLRKKRRREISREQQFAFLGKPRIKLYRTKGGNRKVRILKAEYANVLDPRTSTTKKVKIATVKENTSNPHYVTRNIMTRGAVVQTEIGLAKITSRPGQDGVINAVLVTAEKAPST